MKIKNIAQIKLNKAKNIFPSNITKVRPEDLLAVSGKKKQFLTQREERAMIDTADYLFKAQEGTDYLAIRKGKNIKFSRF